MNCKPGDLARAVRARYTPDMLGRYVHVVRRASKDEVSSEDSYDGVVWIVRGATGGLLPVTFPDGRRDFRIERPYNDGALRPIRDPGDDAVDESKAWLPPVPLPTINPELIPSKEKA